MARRAVPPALAAPPIPALSPVCGPGAPANDAGRSPLHDPAPGRLLISVAEARDALGVGTTKLYALLGDGSLRARRLGGRTLIESASLRAFVESLPVAEFGRPAEAADPTPPARRRGRPRRVG